MGERQVICKKLLLLIGSNPLPNFITTIVLNPESVCLLYTTETAPIKNRLKDILKARNERWVLSEQHIKDATDPLKVRESFPQISEGTHLNYTGGTKIMAAHALIAFRESGGTDRCASYLDERNAILRFDDENIHPIDLSKEDIRLTIDEILGLHGITIQPQKTNQHGYQSLPTDKDTETIVAKVLEDTTLARTLYELSRDQNGKILNITDAKKNPLQLDQFVPGMSVNQFPHEKWNGDIYNAWRVFLESGWLEGWCGSMVHKIAKHGTVHVDIQCMQKADNREFQIDVMLVRGHRLYVISCTTEAESIGLCKHKLFEVAMRARKLGGDLARSALVCLINGTSNGKSKRDLLRSDAADFWDAPNIPRVFGLDDLQAWYGFHGKPNVHNLIEWLES